MSDVEFPNQGSPTPAESFVTGDGVSLVGAGLANDPLRAIGTIGPSSGDAVLRSAAAIPAGRVIYVSAANVASAAQADGSAAGNALGFTTKPTTAAAQILEWSLIGAIIQTIATWASSSGEMGGLTPGAVYYLSQTEAGKITKTEPVSGQVVVVGKAISATAMAVSIAPPITLS